MYCFTNPKFLSCDVAFATFTGEIGNDSKNSAYTPGHSDGLQEHVICKKRYRTFLAVLKGHLNTCNILWNSSEYGVHNL